MVPVRQRWRCTGRFGSTVHSTFIQPFMRISAERLRSTMRREVGTSMAEALSTEVSPRDTV